MLFKATLYASREFSWQKIVVQKWPNFCIKYDCFFNKQQHPLFSFSFGKKQTNKQTKKAKYSYTNAYQYKIMINNSFIFACLSFTL